MENEDINKRDTKGKFVSGHHIGRSKGIGNTEVIADSAEPKSIAQLFDLGINVVDSIKGKDSVLAGIHKVKEYNIKITANSRNGIRELKHYRWRMDRNGVSLNEPIKMYDHLLDGVRYVVQARFMVRKIHVSKMRVF
jgi:phage terminase large subunit